MAENDIGEHQTGGKDIIQGAVDEGIGYHSAISLPHKGDAGASAAPDPVPGE